MKFFDKLLLSQESYDAVKELVYLLLFRCLSVVVEYSKKGGLISGVIQTAIMTVITTFETYPHVCARMNHSN